MGIIEIKKDPSRRELRFFGLLLLLLFAIVAALVYWQTGHTVTPTYLLAMGAVLALVYYAVPPLRRWIYLGWLYATFPIGWSVSMVLLAVAYYVVLTPVGLIMRLSRYDPLCRRREPSTSSYWVPRARSRGVGAYFRQF